MGEVVQGPWGSIQFDQHIVNPNEDFLDDVVDDLCNLLFEWMRDYGFDHCEQEQYDKDLGFICESIRSYLMKLQERYHPIQDVSDAFFNKEEDILYVNNEVNVIFRDE